VLQITKISQSEPYIDDGFWHNSTGSYEDTRKVSFSEAPSCETFLDKNHRGGWKPQNLPGFRYSKITSQSTKQLLIDQSKLVRYKLEPLMVCPSIIRKELIASRRRTGNFAVTFRSISSRFWRCLYQIEAWERCNLITQNSFLLH
jgi:hypothetical protein